VIVACHEQNIFKMGGLWKKLPLAYASFIVGGAAGCPAAGDRRFLSRTKSSGKPSPAATTVCCTPVWSVRS
jgi:NADH:ubiquinone oxidoreductase subunit 5 (subunit L)/multisubunit Na+/H+ antiporter MnhA subunit